MPTDLARWRRQIPKQIEFVHARPLPVPPGGEPVPRVDRRANLSGKRLGRAGRNKRRAPG